MLDSSQSNQSSRTFEQGLTENEYTQLKQGVVQDQIRALQEGIVGAGTVQPIVPLAPQLPAWPTSRPGPLTTPPPVGTHPINSLRPEQVTGLENQTSDTFGEELPLHALSDPYLEQRVNIGQPEAAPEPHKKPKQRL